MSVKLRLARTLALAETSRLLLTPPSRPSSAPLRLLGEASTPGWTDRYQPTGALRSARDHSIVMLNLLQKSYQWFRQKSGSDSAVRSEFVITGMIFHQSRVKSELLHKYIE